MKAERVDDSGAVAGTVQLAQHAVSGIFRAAVNAMFLRQVAASLILQVVWFKQLQFVLGTTTLSVSVTVASFFWSFNW
jgi:spermidine synthase